MYKTADHIQHSFFNFNQPLGIHMNPENRWIKMDDSIPGDVFEEKYVRKIKRRTGNVIKLYHKEQIPLDYYQRTMDFPNSIQ